MKRILVFGLTVTLALLFLQVTSYSREASQKRGKNLYRLVKNKTLKVYLENIISEDEKISNEDFKKMLSDIISARKKESFEVTGTKEEAEVVVDATLLDFIYLDKDPVDHLAGGTYGLLIDAMVKQNYARINAKFIVKRVRDNRKLWSRKYYVTVTQTEMPEPDSIPKVLKECCNRFIFLCFGKPKR